MGGSYCWSVLDAERAHPDGHPPADPRLHRATDAEELSKPEIIHSSATSPASYPLIHRTPSRNTSRWLLDIQRREITSALAAAWYAPPRREGAT